MAQSSHPGEHTALWIASTTVPSYPELQEDITVDVAVLGAGIVGVLTAYLLKKEGRKVALIESHRALHGVTGNTTAKLTASHGLIYSHLVPKFGEKLAALYAKANMGAIEWVEGMSKEIPCDFKREDLFLYAESDKELKDLEKELEASHACGLTTILEEDLDTNFPTKGALRFPNQAEFHPLKFLIPLLEKIPGSGSAVFEHTRALEVKEGSPCKVTTDKGVITAKDVVVATHFPIFDPAFYYTRLDPFRDYALAVSLNEPVPKPMYVGVSDSSYTLRTQPSKKGDLLIIGGGSHKVGEGGDTKEKYQELEDFARKHFKVKEVAYSWSTQDNQTLDKVPYIGRISARSKRVFVATGFNGWGMAHGVVAAQLNTDLICGRKNEFADLYAPTRFKPVTSAPQ
ncbi:MAG TPA: FAD-binding oxidoreductase, partial [Verrucomicrobiae bacterium]|nr:FAD-binding oxidoreductase [Verrucomicrobiae bacterium]